MTDKNTRISDIVDRAAGCGKIALLYTEDSIRQQGEDTIKVLGQNVKRLFQDENRYVLITDDEKIYKFTNNIIKCH